MALMMIGSVLILAAALSPGSPAAPPAAFRPISGATAHATASIRIISGARFGPDYSEMVAGAIRRSTQLADRDGQRLPAILLEFQ